MVNLPISKNSFMKTGYYCVKNKDKSSTKF